MGGTGLYPANRANAPGGQLDGNGLNPTHAPNDGARTATLGTTTRLPRAIAKVASPATASISGCVSAGRNVLPVRGPDSVPSRTNFVSAWKILSRSSRTTSPGRLSATTLETRSTSG